MIDEMYMQTLHCLCANRPARACEAKKGDSSVRPVELFMVSVVKRIFGKSKRLSIAECWRLIIDYFFVIYLLYKPVCSRVQISATLSGSRLRHGLC